MNEPLPPWVEMIHDLVEGAGYSYSRIAYRMHVSPSTIQKLATKPDRTPRHRVYHHLLSVHHKVFNGPYATAHAKKYWAEKLTAQEKISQTILSS